MNHDVQPTGSFWDRTWVIYTKAISFLLPSIIVFGLATVFVLPKIKQMCADTGFNPRALFQPLDFIHEQSLWMLFGTAALVIVFEKWVPFWRRHRKAFLASIVFLTNSAVLVALLGSLIVAAMVGPAMNRH